MQIPDAYRRPDEDVRGDVLEALMLDVSVPMTIDVQARDGFVTLTGTTQWHYQREAAESRTTDVPGVAGIDNAIILTQAPDARDAVDAISGAVRRHAVLAAEVLSVETSFGRGGDPVRHGEFLGRARSRGGRRLVGTWRHSG